MKAAASVKIELNVVKVWSEHGYNRPFKVRVVRGGARMCCGV